MVWYAKTITGLVELAKNYLLRAAAFRLTLNSGLNCQQLDRRQEAITQKRSYIVNRKIIVLHQDNVRPHKTIVRRKKLWKLGLNVLCIHLIVRTWHQITIWSYLRQLIMQVKNSPQEKYFKFNCPSYVPIRRRFPMKVALRNFLKHT